MSKFTSAAPYIACFVLLRRGNTVAFVKRGNTGYMDGYYGLPSGKVEWGESYTQAAIRESEEEVGVLIKPEHMHHALTLHRHDEDSDWIDILFEVDDWGGEVINAEPNVHDEVKWLDIDNLPDNVVPPIRYALERLKAGAHYAEYGWANS